MSARGPACLFGHESAGPMVRIRVNNGGPPFRWCAGLPCVVYHTSESPDQQGGPVQPTWSCWSGQLRRASGRAWGVQAGCLVSGSVGWSGGTRPVQVSPSGTVRGRVGTAHEVVGFLSGGLSRVLSRHTTAGGASARLASWDLDLPLLGGPEQPGGRDSEWTAGCRASDPQRAARRQEWHRA
jgi:hypothetical protein